MHQQLKNLKKKDSGFTIIEVMIVLVIAAVIILIVFLAVPALQRNSRNNQRKNDVSRISAAVTETANNSNGDLPTAAPAAGIVGNLGYYTSIGYNAGTAAVAAVTNAETVTYVRASTCTSAQGSTPASGRQFVILYAVETGSSTPTAQCLQG